MLDATAITSTGLRYASSSKSIYSQRNSDQETLAIGLDVPNFQISAFHATLKILSPYHPAKLHRTVVSEFVLAFETNVATWGG